MVPAGEEGEKRRDIRIDLLRVVGAIAVVWLHVSARVVTASPDVLNMGWWAGNLADAMSRWSVPLFVMASGALLLSPDVEAEPGRFYRRRGLKGFSRPSSFGPPSTLSYAGTSRQSPPLRMPWCVAYFRERPFITCGTFT